MDGELRLSSPAEYLPGVESKRVLFCGDVVGEPGRKALSATLPALIDEHQPDLVVTNGENVAGGLGITERTAEKILARAPTSSRPGTTSTVTATSMRSSMRRTGSYAPRTTWTATRAAATR